jgi:hypothetical protein
VPGVTVMRQSLLVAIVCVLSLVSPLNGQDNSYLGDIYLVGTIIPGLSDDADVTILSNDGSEERCLTFNTPAGTLCSGNVRSGTTSARIQIRTRGYKVYAINIPQLTFDHGVTRVNIGTISLTKSELPSVQKILASESQEGRHRVFELTLLNKQSRDILITGLSVSASRRGDGMRCCCPPLAIFEISDDLKVVGGGDGTLRADGTYQEKTHGQDHVFRVTSQIEIFTCDGSTTLELSLPVSFVIPKNSYSAIQVILPETFTIKGSRYHFYEKVKDPNLKPRPEAETGQLSQFDGFSFTLSTGEKDELDIEAAYPTPPK